MGIRTHHLGQIAVLGFTLVFSSAPVVTQNGSSFLDANRSTVSYSVATVSAETACEALRSVGGYEYSVVSATLVEATARVPEHCRVFGIIPPEIRFGVHLPTNWNTRFYMQGNGGYAGNAPEAETTLRTAMRAVAHGFVAASTDTGHSAQTEPLGAFAYNNLQKEIDYGFRAVHLTTVTAKTLIESYYAAPARYSYWDGCSTGGRQGLMEAQRFPADFDGIVAGAPVLNFTDTQTAYIWNNQALARTPLTESKVALVGEAVYNRCDAADGLADGLLADPRQCNFDPAADLLVCGNSRTADCFTSGEIETLTAIYEGPMANGHQLFPGQPLGAETGGGWTNWIVSDNRATISFRFSEAFFKYLAFTPDEPDFDWHTFNFNTDPDRVTIRTILDATDPDLSAFHARGGKMITYFGWADAALNPIMGVNYYEKVEASLGAETTSEFYRLFMVPGMFHCDGGLGTDQFDAITPLINWVENGIPPDTIPAARVEAGAVTRTRPLCPYPEIATYTGLGSIDTAANFVCAAP